VIANNTVDGAAFGVSVCNFNEGGRIAVVQGNIIRNLLPKRPIGTARRRCRHRHLCRGRQFGHRQCDRETRRHSASSRWGKYLRDVAITGNVIEGFAGSACPSCRARVPRSSTTT